MSTSKQFRIISILTGMIGTLALSPGQALADNAPATAESEAVVPEASVQAVVPEAAAQAAVPAAVAEEVPPAVAEEVPPAVAEEVPPAVAEEVPPAVAEEVPAAVAEEVPPATSPEAGDGMTEPVGDDAADSNESPARQVIGGLNAALLNVLKQSNELDYSQRFDLLKPALDDKFDLEYMARQSVGRSFLKLEEEDRKTWYSLFATYMTANYASRFDHYSGQHFEILGEEPGAKGTVLVKSMVIDPEQDDVPMSYRLRETEAGWKVVDVYLKGTISEIALRRSEYAAVLKREGFAPLVASIKERIETLESGSE